jgi:hypothetical protein
VRRVLKPEGALAQPMEHPRDERVRVAFRGATACMGPRTRIGIVPISADRRSAVQGDANRDPPGPRAIHSRPGHRLLHGHLVRTGGDLTTTTSLPVRELEAELGRGPITVG